ncbi:polysaccharide biosynthesis protein [Pontibaca salina]|uniref:Polysaccharide biosynthesis protein n=1 Tax=Pontibaca salina TaxID=2795731 RepID=A0A934HSK1_9RHOB|nr:nucleoside-diphosphate sugar epimerase/dehydratase [Pontibaca salina]MBI6630637.1 polysaccharide biosynthesis protein [Pontibaca salina]
MLTLITALTRAQKTLIFLTIDLCLVPLALLFTFWVQHLPGPALELLEQTLPVLPWLLGLVAALALGLGLPMVQLKAFEGRAVARAAMLAAGAGAGLAGLFWLAGLGLPPGFYLVFALGYFLFMMGLRAILLQVVLGLYRRAGPRRRVMIYGAGTTGRQLALGLKTDKTIDPVAFIDDNILLQGVLVAGLPVYPPARLAQQAQARDVRRILLAMPSLRQPKQAQIARRLQQLGLEVQTLPSFAQLIGEEALVDKLVPVAPQHFLGRAARDNRLGKGAAAYAGRVVLVSGAGGSIGAELCRQILNCRPSRLVLFELSELALYTVHRELGQLLEDSAIELVPVLGSVTDLRHVRRVLAKEGVQVVVHAAAYKHVPLIEANPLSGLANNVFGTQILGRAAARAGVERFILISSDKAVRPANVMGASKRLAELVVQDLATRHDRTVFAMVRFGNVLGSSGSVVPLFQEQVRRGGPVTVTDPRVTRYFMTIREAVQLVLKAGAGARGGETFVLDMGPPVPILKLARQVIESAGYSVRDAAHPEGDIEITITGLRPGEKLQEELSLSGALIPTPYQKIFCAREAQLSELEVAAVLRGLRAALAASDVAAARVVLAHWVEPAPSDPPVRAGRKTS